MPVKRGDEWGEATTAPIDAVEVHSDAALAAVVTGAEPRPVVVRGGDVHRSLGAPAATRATMRVPIDLITVTADGRRLAAVAHVIARRRGSFGWWRGRIVAVMNVDHLGDWDAAPRAHPNDGWLDVIEVDQSMSLRARWQAWRRLRTGSHVPHPDVTRATCSGRDVRLRQLAWLVGRRRRTRHGSIATRRGRAGSRRGLRVVGPQVLTTCWTTSNPSSSAPVDTGLLSADSAFAWPCPKA